MTPEEQAREKINRLIEAAGWTYREEALAGRRSGRGFSDYLLYDAGGRAVAVLKAKRADVPSLSGKEQAREYADSIGVRHVFLSNGEFHYHWVKDAGNPVRIMALPILDELDQVGQQPVIDRSPLWETPVNENFLRTRTMRPYQLAAVRAVQESAETGRHGFCWRWRREPVRPRSQQRCVGFTYRLALLSASCSWWMATSCTTGCAGLGSTTGGVVQGGWVPRP